MKQISNLIIALALISISNITFSQSALKIGHVNINELMASLPERDSAQVLLDKETKEIQATYEEMQVRINIAQEFEQNASLTLQKRNIELFQPIYDKIIKAIEKVANENSFTYILDISNKSVVFTSKDSQNINSQVLSLKCKHLKLN